MPRTALFVSWFLILLSITSPCSALKDVQFPNTEEEFARLPGFCRARLRPNESEQQVNLWKQRIGDACFMHVHHYCLALNIMNFTQTVASKADRETYLQRAFKGGFDYMWGNAGPKCGLMPEIFVNKGRAFLMIDKPYQALEAFRKAIELNQRYVPAYVELAGLYTKSGQTDTAKTILEYALKVDPNSKSIQRRLADLEGGKKGASSANKAPH